MTSSFPLAGKVALVTGSSKGIGAAIAKRLASDGASVVINYANSAPPAEKLVNDINNEGKGKAISIKADVSLTSDAKRLVEETVQAFGQLDILVLNAGQMTNQVLSEIDEQDFDKIFNINVKIPLFMTQAAVPHLKSGSRVIFFSTSLTKNTSPAPDYLLYIATKGAVNQFVRVLAKDLGSKGITVNGIAPGPVDTDLFRQGKTDQQVQFFANLHPEKRIGLPNDVAPVAAFLARQESQWVNGQILFVNGGFNV